MSKSYRRVYDRSGFSLDRTDDLLDRSALDRDDARQSQDREWDEPAHERYVVASVPSYGVRGKS